MSALAVIDVVEVRDPQKLTEYAARVPALVDEYGGRYLVRGGEPVAFEGDWKPSFVVVIEFPTREKALAFYEAAEYQPFKSMRQEASTSNIVVVDTL